MAGKIKVRTLSVQELRDNDTSVYLLSIIKSVLQSFSIDIEDVYSFTTDNGSNMIKMRKFIADAQRASIQRYDGDVSDHLDGDFRATAADHMNDRTEFLEESLLDDEDWDDANEMIDVIEVIEIRQPETKRNDVLEKTK